MSFSTRISHILPTITLILMIVISISILYGPGLNYPFFFDDYNNLMNDQGQVNALIKDPSQTINNLLAHPLQPDRNLALLSFATSYKLSKMNPAGFRLINLVLHGLNTLLLYLLLSLLLYRYDPPTPTERARVCWPALAGALFFLCHPLSLNTVLYITQRFGALASFFYLLGFYAWLKGRSNPDKVSVGWRQCLWFLLTVLAFWSALHCKEMAITLPLTILIYEIYARGSQSIDRKKILAQFTLLFMIAAIFLFFAWQIGLFNQSWINIGFFSKRLWSPGIHFLSETRAFFHYWKLLFLPLPHSLSLHHEFSPSLNYCDPAALTAIMGHIFLIVAALKMRRHAPLIGFGIIWFYLILGPPYLFLPQKELLVEYKTYLAAPGAALVICGFLTVIKNKLSGEKKTSIRYLAYCIIGIWLLLLTTITWQRQPVFQSNLTLWSDVLQKYPTSRRALNNRAVAHLKNRSLDKALTDLNTLVENHPTYARGFENRGRLRLYLKNYRGAATDFQKTLSLLPDEPELKNTVNQIKKLEVQAQRAAKRENLQ